MFVKIALSLILAFVLAILTFLIPNQINWDFIGWQVFYTVLIIWVIVGAYKLARKFIFKKS